MSIGSLGFGAIGAGVPLAQTKGSDVDRAEVESSAQQRQVDHELKAEQAAGIGQADGEEHETEDRDADGRRLWERMGKKKPADEPAASPIEEAPHSRDATGQRGIELDLLG
jgi:hypothetical protein